MILACVGLISKNIGAMGHEDLSHGIPYTCSLGVLGYTFAYLEYAPFYRLDVPGSRSDCGDGASKLHLMRFQISLLLERSKIINPTP